MTIFNFLNKITSGGELVIEYCFNCNSQTKQYKYNEIITNYPEKTNLFFSTGIKEKGVNRSTTNISFINRITLDLDLRNNCKNLYGINPTDEEIIEEGLNIGEYLKINHPDDYGQWSFIVFSGNGLHIHYIGKINTVEGENYHKYFKETNNHIVKVFNEIFKGCYIADKAVGDLGHLFRLPDTINEKNGEQHKCQIIAIQNVESFFVNHLSELIELSKIRIEKCEIYYNKSVTRKFNTLKFHKDNQENVFEKIRKEVPVDQIMLYFAPERKIQKDGKNFTKPGKKGNNSYFVDKQNNIIIRNGSKFLAGDKDGMNPLDLVESYLDIHGQELLQFFVDKKFISLI